MLKGVTTHDLRILCLGMMIENKILIGWVLVTDTALDQRCIRELGKAQTDQCTRSGQAFIGDFALHRRGIDHGAADTSDNCE